MRTGRERRDSTPNVGSDGAPSGDAHGLGPVRLKMALKRRAAARAGEAAAENGASAQKDATGASPAEAEARDDADPMSAERAADEAGGDEPAAAVAEAKDGANDPQAALALAMTGRLIPLPHADALPPPLRALAKRVKCYVGPAAKRACAMVGAEAFAVGDVVVFATDSPSVEVVRHELEHVRQQGAAPADPSAPLDKTAPGDHDETEARQAESGDSPTAPEEEGAAGPKMARYEALVSPSPAPVVQLRTNPDDGNAVFTLPAETRVRRVGSRPGARPGEAGWVQGRGHHRRPHGPHRLGHRRQPRAAQRDHRDPVGGRAASPPRARGRVAAGHQHADPVSLSARRLLRARTSWRRSSRRRATPRRRYLLSRRNPARTASARRAGSTSPPLCR